MNPSMMMEVRTGREAACIYKEVLFRLWGCKTHCSTVQGMYSIIAIDYIFPSMIKLTTCKYFQANHMQNQWVMWWLINVTALLDLPCIFGPALR